MVSGGGAAAIVVVIVGVIVADGSTTVPPSSTGGAEAEGGGVAVADISGRSSTVPFGFFEVLEEEEVRYGMLGNEEK